MNRIDTRSVETRTRNCSHVPHAQYVYVLHYVGASVLRGGQNGVHAFCCGSTPEDDNHGEPTAAARQRTSHRIPSNFTAVTKSKRFRPRKCTGRKGRLVGFRRPTALYDGREPANFYSLTVSSRRVMRRLSFKLSTSCSAMSGNRTSRPNQNIRTVLGRPDTNNGPN